MNFWYSLGSLVVGMLIGAALGFYFTRKNFKKQLKENPPIILLMRAWRRRKGM